MNVLIVNDTYPPDVNGAAYFTKRLAEGLAERDHEIHVLCVSTTLHSEVVTRGGVVETSPSTSACPRGRRGPSRTWRGATSHASSTRPTS